MITLLRTSFTAQVVAMALLAFGALKANNLYQRHKGGTQIIEKSKEAGKIANAKATKAHEAAQKPGAAERLKQKACRDC